MNKLETAVRPFQTGDVFTARVLPPMQAETVPPDPISVKWGKPISLMLAKAGGKWEVIAKWPSEDEIARTTSTVRVTNPTDPSQYVDVERIDSLTLRAENGLARTLTLNNPPA